ncbi:MAG: transposase [Anaerolineae bacterium]|nr:transposase [Anaerolineae bacterium]
MHYDATKHRRRSIRLPGYDYTQPGAYFVTINTCGHELLFGEVADSEVKLNAYGEIAWEEWFRGGELRANVELDAFVVMPNHVHGVIVITHAVGATRRVAPTERPAGPSVGSIGAIIAQYKSIVTKRINALRQTPGVPVWQRNYYEHVIRNEDSLQRVREYVANNPARWEEDRYCRR